VILAFAQCRWGTPEPPIGFLLSGEKKSVDTRLGDSIYVTKDKGNVWDVLGEGLLMPEYLGNALGLGANFYRDRHRIRLIALWGSHFGSDTVILSAESRHEALLVDEDLGALRTESGIGLGDSGDRLADVLGNPSARDDSAEYEIHWYLGEVQEEDVGRYACASAYALKEDRVVEIWLHVWSPDPHG
jgi:hypothetical protein